MTDVAQLFIVRYKRNSTEDNMKPERKKNSIWDALQEQELDSASQLVARYNGSAETLEVQVPSSEFFSFFLFFFSSFRSFNL